MTIPRPRVGHIQFLNCLPLYWGLIHSGALLDVELVKDTPDRPQRRARLRRGRPRADQPGRVPPAHRRAGAAARPRGGQDGPVLSVNLVSQVPLAELDGEPVALGSTSRTTRAADPDVARGRVRRHAALLHLPARPRRDDAGGRRRRAHRRRRAAGDATRRPAAASPCTTSGRPGGTGPGCRWCSRSGRSAGTSSPRHPGLVKDVHQAFLRSRDLSLEHVDEVARSAARWESFDEPDPGHLLPDPRLLARGPRSSRGYGSSPAAPPPAGPYRPRWLPSSHRCDLRVRVLLGRTDLGMTSRNPFEE